MAQTGFTPIQLYHTSTASAVPTAGNLNTGELAINLLDERLYFKNSSGVVKLLASNAGSLGNVVGPASATNDNIAAFDGTTGKLLKQVSTTGSGSVVLSTSPTLVTPVLGVATGTSFQGIIGNVTPAAGSFTTLSVNSTVTFTGTTAQIAIGTSQTTGTLTMGGTSGTGAISIGRSTSAQTIGIGTGVNTAATKTINIGTGSTGATGVTNITLGTSNAAAQATSLGLLQGRWSTSSALQGAQGFTIDNTPTGAYIAPAQVVLNAYTAANNSGNYTSAYQAGSIGWTDTNFSSFGEAEFSITTTGSGGLLSTLYHKPTNGIVYVGASVSSSNFRFGTGNTTAVGAFALTSPVTSVTLPSPTGTIAIGRAAGNIPLSGGTPLGYTMGNDNIYIGVQAGVLSAGAGLSSTIGSYNICFGSNAGTVAASSSNAQIGSYNTLIGTQAGSRLDNLLGDNNICIGYFSGYNLLGGVNDVTVIGGNLSTAEAAAASGDVLIGNGNGGLLLNATWSSTVFSRATVSSDWTSVSGFGATAPTTVNASTYTVLSTAHSLIFTTTNCTVTLPSASTNSGRILVLKNITANSVVSASSNVVPLASATAGTAILSATSGKFAYLQSNGTNWVVMMAN